MENKKMIFFEYDIVPTWRGPMVRYKDFLKLVNLIKKLSKKIVKLENKYGS